MKRKAVKIIMYLVLAVAMAPEGKTQEVAPEGYATTFSYAVSGDGNAYQAGLAAAREAESGLSEATPKLVLMITNGNAILEQALEGVKDVFDSSIIFGWPTGSSMLTQNGRGDRVIVIAISGDAEFSFAEAPKGDPLDQFASGETIGNALNSISVPGEKGHLMILVGDCHLTENIDLVNGIKSVLGNRHPFIGGVTYAYVVEGEIVLSGSNMALLVWGSFDLSFGMRSALDGDRSVPLLLEHAHESVSDALAGNEAVPQLVMTFDCNGRYRLLNDGNALDAEADTILSALGDGIPFVGNYSDGEMGTDADNVPVASGYSVLSVAIYPREVPVASTIELISPNGGREWDAGIEQSISWQATDLSHNGKLEIEIFQVNGELIYSFAGTNKRSSVMNPVPEPGVYLIKARTGKGIIMERMVRK